jgi:geranylgeranyl pyrophosphate synthase
VVDFTCDQKQLIDSALAPVATELSLLAPHLSQLLQAKTASGRHIIDHILGAGGKRVRPGLYFFASRLVNYKGEHLLPMAAVCEYVHTASLLHDDVIDNSSLRRGKPTPNKVWGDESAVLVGDLIYSRASELMADTGSLHIVRLFARAIRLMSDGELLQLEHLYNPSMPENTYYEIIENKTAVLLSAVCKAPAILANTGPKAEDALAEFGRCVGFAFQLLDDALDYASNDKIFGKKTLADLPEGKVTLPVILLKSLATPQETAFLENLIHSEDISREAMLKVLDLVNKYDTAGKTLEEASKWTDRALAALSDFPPSESRSNLETLARRLLMRFN